MRQRQLPPFTFVVAVNIINAAVCYVLYMYIYAYIYQYIFTPACMCELTRLLAKSSSPSLSWILWGSLLLYRCMYVYTCISLCIRPCYARARSSSSRPRRRPVSLSLSLALNHQKRQPTALVVSMSKISRCWCRCRHCQRYLRDFN